MAKFLSVKNFFLDLIFPRYCLGCRKELSVSRVSHLCETCFDSIYINKSPQCFICRQRSSDGRTCQRCRRKTVLTGFLACGRYEDPVLRESIHHLKYSFLSSLKKPLGETAIKFIRQNKLESIFENIILVPVPLSRRRLATRGFNQSELIAREIGSCFGCPVRTDLIKRNHFCRPQAEIDSWASRKENISGAFGIKSRKAVADILKNGNRLILVDDVLTSGATLEECAEILKNAGIKEIWGLVVARG